MNLDNNLFGEEVEIEDKITETVNGAEVRSQKDFERVTINAVSSRYGFEGTPEVLIREVKGKNYNKAFIHVFDSVEMEVLTLYVNYPRNTNKKGFNVIKPASDKFDFYLDAFNFVVSMKTIAGVDVDESKGQACNMLELFKALDSADSIKVVKVDNPYNSDYPSFKLMESEY